MPRVPTYDEFQATPQVAPAARAETSVTPQMMSVSGEQMQQVGRGMQSAGDAFSKIAVDIQKDINDAVTKEADNAAAQTISQVMGDYMNRSGKDAVVSQDSAKKAIEDALRSSGEGLQNNMQRQMYGDVAMRRMQQSLGQINMHAAGQAKVWNEVETGARLGNARRDATTAWGTWDQEGSEYAAKKATMIAETDALVKLKYGADPDSEVAKQARLTQTTGLAADTIQNMLVANKSKMASDYFAKAMERGEIDPEKAKPIQDMIKSASVKDEALTLSMSLKGGLESKLSQLDEKFKKGEITAEVHEAASRNVEHKWQVQKTAEGEYTKSVIGQSTDWFIHNGGKSVLDFQTANPVLYESLKRQGRLGDLITLAQHGGKVQNDGAVWADVMTNMQDLKHMTPTEIYNKYSLKLDESHLEKLYSIHSALNGSKDEQHLSIMSNTEMVSNSAKTLGILPQTGKPSDKQDAQFQQFQSAVDARVAAYEATELKGQRKASQNELKKILQEVEMDKVYKSEWGRDPQKPVMSMKPEDMKDAYVVVTDINKQTRKAEQIEVPVVAVPPDVRAAIVGKLHKRKMPVTEQSIVQLWVSGGRPISAKNIQQAEE